MAHKGYTLNYFIDFFSDIPANRWTVNDFLDTETGKCCALGHAILGKNPSESKIEALKEGADVSENSRASALDDFLHGRTISVNDNSKGEFTHLGSTPRTRILRALRNRKKHGNINGKE